jgi:thiosulfate dehydrogenase (quinone) large subunit
LAITLLFIYSGSWQILQNYSAGGFLNHVVTFYGFFAPFATTTMLPLTDFLIKTVHLLIGLSLVSGLMVRISGPCPMDGPFIQDHLSLFVDCHLVYAIVIVYLMAHHAGYVRGLDGLVERMPWVDRHPRLFAREAPDKKAVAAR